LFRRDPLAGPFPYKFVVEQELAKNASLFDLDNNGKEEFVDFNIDDLENNLSHLHVRSSAYDLIDQENFYGKITNIFSVNWNADENKELFVPYSRNDSLFLRILDKNVNILKKEIFLFSGKTLIDENGFSEWRGKIDQIESLDINADGEKEFIFFANESTAKSPRGVFVFNRNFNLLWKYEIGPRLSKVPIIHDFDGDGLFEIILPTSAPCNGNSSNGTDDEHSYIIAINHLGQELWTRKIGGSYSSVKIKLDDLNGDGNEDIIAFYSEWNKTNIQPHLEIIDPLNNGIQIIPRRNLPLKEATFAILQMDKNISKEILVVDATGKILVLDHNLNIVKSKATNMLGNDIFVSEDLNNDGHPEILIGHSKGTTCLDHELSILGQTPLKIYGDAPVFHIYHKNVESASIVFKNNRTHLLVSLKKDPYFLFSYYGSAIGILTGFLVILTLIIGIIIFRNQQKYWNKVFENFAATYKQPVFIFDQNLFLLYTNSAGSTFLNISQSKFPCSLDTLTDGKKTFTDKISFLKNAEAIHHQREFTFTKNKIIHLIAEPIQFYNLPNPYWLIIFQDSKEKELIEEAKSWSAMAQRIAHDIKNPLTSIQLSLQRLQMEYQKQDKKHVKNYDRYTDRILERIEFLKRQTRDFMKFVNLEKLNLQPANLNEIIENIFCSAKVEIPDDIKLIKQFSQEIPIIHLDQEQMQSVLENLITNAINAMPNGGTLTISTSMASDLQIPNGKEKKSDYVILEIMDTGVGINDELREKLFLPFSTNTHLGTGLGLMIVKKIIDDHQGFIEVNSEVDVGTSFIIYLPVA
jgi:nitrogen-specific signal transduction histidine kinase